MNVALVSLVVEMRASISTSAQRVNTTVPSQIPNALTPRAASSAAAWPGTRATMPAGASTRTNVPMGRPFAH